jgi:drug/metabolite transporter (DMT)-like permease
MPILAIALLFISAILHTTWNILLKQAGEKYIATWWAVLVGSAIFLPALFFTGLPLRETWGLLATSVLVETAYYITLSAAYRAADFSLVYPLARGTAPAFIALWALLFLGEKPSPGGSLGLGIIIIGLLIIGGSVFAQVRSLKTPHLRGIGLALLLSLFISIYTVIDGAAVKRTPAFPYATLVFFLSPVLSTPLVLKNYGWQTLKTEWRNHYLRLSAIGILTVGAYLLALAAYSVAPVSYSGAVREVSVVLGAFAGWKFLGERLGGWRLAGAVIVFSGILVIAAWG